VFEFELILLQKLCGSSGRLKWPTEGQAIGVAIAVGVAPIVAADIAAVSVVAAAIASQK